MRGWRSKGSGRKSDAFSFEVDIYTFTYVESVTICNMYQLKYHLQN